VLGVLGGLAAGGSVIVPISRYSTSSFLTYHATPLQVSTSSNSFVPFGSAAAALLPLHLTLITPYHQFNTTKILITDMVSIRLVLREIVENTRYGIWRLIVKI
jgi:hypothetical protein